MAHGTPCVSTDVGLVADYLIPMPGSMDRRAVFDYREPGDIMRAIEFTNPDELTAISGFVKSVHSHDALRSAWAKELAI